MGYADLMSRDLNSRVVMQRMSAEVLRLLDARQSISAGSEYNETLSKRDVNSVQASPKIANPDGTDEPQLLKICSHGDVPLAVSPYPSCQ